MNYKPVFATALALTGLGLVGNNFLETAKAEKLAYPEAKVETIEEEFGGTTIKDPYRWLENFEAEETKLWAEEADALTLDYLKGEMYEETFERLKILSDFNLSFGATGRGDDLFFIRRPKNGRQNALYFSNDSETILIGSEDIVDPEMTNPVIGSTNLLATVWPTQHGDFVAFGYADEASLWFRLKVLDVETGQVLPETITGIYGGFSTVTWQPDGSGFYYLKFRPESSEDDVGGRPLPVGIFFHQLGTSGGQDKELFSLSEDTAGITFPIVSEDGNYLLLGTRDSATLKDTFQVYDLRNMEKLPVSLFEQTPAKFNYLGNRGTQLYFQTDLDAPNGKIISSDISDGGKIRVIIPETKEAMLAGSTAGGDVYGFIANSFILGYLVDGAPNVKVFDENGTFKYQVDIPTGASIWGGVNGLASGKFATFSVLGILDPRTVYSLEVETGELIKKNAVELPVEAADLDIKRVFYNSKDGTRVPMYVVHKKGLELDGNNPTFMYGYGFHSWVSFLWYQPHILHLIELGGVYAIPAIRGGGEYGETWHNAGIKENRQNAIDDFVSAGQWLIENNYTNNKRLVANGGSSSAPLAGTIAIKYGDVFAGAIIDIPFSDLVRAYHYGTGIFLIGEYGSPEIVEEQKMLIEHSPYYQAGKPACFIPTLVMVGEKDQTATPFHGYKLTANLQNNQTCENPILMKLMRNTGHNFGSTPDQIADNRAAQIVFLRKILDF